MCIIILMSLRGKTLWGATDAINGLIPLSRAIAADWVCQYFDTHDVLQGEYDACYTWECALCAENIIPLIMGLMRGFHAVSTRVVFNLCKAFVSLCIMHDGFLLLAPSPRCLRVLFGLFWVIFASRVHSAARLIVLTFILFAKCWKSKQSWTLWAGLTFIDQECIFSAWRQKWRKLV